MYAGDTSGDAESADYAGIPFIYAAYGFGNVSSDKYIAKIDDIKNLPVWKNSNTGRFFVFMIFANPPKGGQISHLIPVISHWD